MAIDIKSLTNPAKVAEAGEAIYKEKFKDEYERLYSGQFVAIDVASGDAFVSQYPEDALQKAKDKSPAGIVHLIRIGSPGAFRVSYSAHAGRNWIFQQTR